MLYLVEVGRSAHVEADADTVVSQSAATAHDSPRLSSNPLLTLAAAG
jgi:hypothetical protein